MVFSEWEFNWKDLLVKNNTVKQSGRTLIDVAQHYSNFLKNEKKCDLVICLSHIGHDYKGDSEKISDKILASKTENIDLILGGHTHTFLPAPETHKNRQGKMFSLIRLVGQVFS